MWFDHAKYCPLCGAGLVWGEVEGRRRLRCAQCEFVLFLNPASAAAAVVLDEDRRVLLVRRSIRPFRGAWALPAGYQEIDEDPRDTVSREVREETGIAIEPLCLRDLLFVPDDERKPANVAVFLCRPTGGAATPVPGHDADAADWFALDALPEDLGFQNGPRILDRMAEGRDLAWALERAGRAGGASS